MRAGAPTCGSAWGAPSRRWSSGATRLLLPHHSFGTFPHYFIARFLFYFCKDDQVCSFGYLQTSCFLLINGTILHRTILKFINNCMYVYFFVILKDLYSRFMHGTTKPSLTVLKPSVPPVHTATQTTIAILSRFGVCLFAFGVVPRFDPFGLLPPLYMSRPPPPARRSQAPPVCPPAGVPVGHLRVFHHLRHGQPPGSG